MKKILEVVGRMDRAGQETFLMNVLRSCDFSQYEITFAVNTNRIGEYEEEIESLGGKIWHNPYAPTFKHLPSYLASFKRFLIKNGPFDVIHCHVFYFSGFLLKIADEANIPIRIMHSHSTTDGLKNSLFRQFYRSLALYLIKKHATKLVACGKDAYRGLFKSECPSESVILNNAILPTDFNLSENNRNMVRTKLNIGRNIKTIISVARFLPVKNHKRIVDIFKAVLQYDPDVLLLLVGEGELKSETKEYASQMGVASKIRFLGSRNDIPQLLDASDVLIMPSLFEGLPVSLVEAQGVGVPCVISSVITEEVDMGLDLVEYVSLNESDERWAQKILLSSQKSKPDYITRMKYLSLKGFTIDATWDKLGRLYDGQ